MYKEYSDEHAVPSKDSLFALLARFLGTSGIMPSTATMITQELIANCIVCGSRLPEFAFDPGGDEVPVPDPELRGLACSVDAGDADALDAWDELVEAIASTTRSGSMKRW